LAAKLGEDEQAFALGGGRDVGRERTQPTIVLGASEISARKKP
jgi:hypothetical protein